MISENRYLKFLIIGTALILLGATLGLVYSNKLFYWDVLGMCAILALIAISTRRYYWGAIFLAFGILFNPVVQFPLDQSIWLFAYIILVGVFIVWFWDYFTNYHKGHLFEGYVLNKFPDSEWIVVNSTKDLHKKFRRFVETDGDPDFVFRNRATGNEVAIECKYRSQYAEGSRGDIGLWWKKWQGERYIRYSHQNNNKPVYIAFGISGNPISPEVVAYVPLGVIQKQYPHFIPKEVFERYTNVPTL